jgi:hypothetical protein
VERLGASDVDRAHSNSLLTMVQGRLNTPHAAQTVRRCETQSPHAHRQVPDGLVGGPVPVEPRCARHAHAHVPEELSAQIHLAGRHRLRHRLETSFVTSACSRFCRAGMLTSLACSLFKFTNYLRTRRMPPHMSSWIL